MHCTKKTPTKRTTPVTATFVAVFAFSGNLHATWNKACPFAFSTKSAYKRRFFVVPAYVLQGARSLMVVTFLFDLATISRLQQKNVGIGFNNAFTSRQRWAWQKHTARTKPFTAFILRTSCKVKCFARLFSFV